MSLSSIIDPANLTPSIVGLRATEYMYAACAAVWTYDYLLTLDREIALVWPSRLCFGKIVFFLNRYNPIIYITLGNHFFHEPQDCRKVLIATFWFYVTGFLWSDIVLSMRVLAIWGGKQVIFIIMTISTTATIILIIVLTQRILESLIVMRIPDAFIPALGLACVPFPRRHDAFWPDFAIDLIYHSVIGALALTKGIQYYRFSPSPLFVTMFYDGLIYYVYTLGRTFVYADTRDLLTWGSVLAVAIVVVTLTAPVQWDLFLELPYGVLCSIISTRILFHIRGSYFTETTDNTVCDSNAKSANPIVFQSQQLGTEFVLQNFDEDGDREFGQGCQPWTESHRVIMA